MKRLMQLCIDKPVIALVLSLVIILFGVVAYTQLDILYLPKQVIPQATIYVSDPGAPASFMESNVADILEDAVFSIDGIQYMSSSSSIGSATVTIQFTLDANFSEAVNELRDKISQAQSNTEWPSDAKQPTLQLQQSGSALLNLSFTDDKESREDLRNQLIEQVVPQLQAVPGVSSVSVVGSSGYQMHIWIDPTKIASLGITAKDVQDAVTNANADFSGGVIEGSARRYGVASDAKLKNPEDFSNVVIKSMQQNVVRLKDVASVQFGSDNLEQAPMRINGKPGVVLVIKPLASYNPITVAEDVKKVFKTVQAKLPPGMHAELLYDQSIFFKKSIEETFYTMVEAIALVMIIVFLFLGSLRASFIPIVTIPVSLLGALAIINVFGFSINVLSLLAIVLAIGLVVDDAIVMLENIYRFLEEGLTPYKAAVIGSAEIATAVIAMSLTLIAVYAPVGMMHGYTAKYFQVFAYTLAGAVIISAFVALTLTPMMCSKILHAGGETNKFTVWLDQQFSRLSSAYASSLRLLLRVRLIGWLAILLSIVVAVIAYTQLNQELIPAEDTGMIDISVVGPGSSTYAYLDAYSKQIESLIKSIPEVSNSMLFGYHTSSHFYLFLKPWADRSRSADAIVTALNSSLKSIVGVTATASVSQISGGSATDLGSPLDITLTTTGSYEDLLPYSDKLLAKLKQNPNLLNPSTSLSFDSQQFKVKVNRDLANSLGISANDIGTTVQALMGGVQVTDIQSGKFSYPVYMQLSQAAMSDLDVLNQLYLRSSKSSAATDSGSASTGSAGTASASDKMIPLSSLVTVTPTITQASMYHYNKFRAAELTAGLAPGYSTSEAINYVKSLLPTVVGSKINYQFSGLSYQFLASQGAMGVLVLLAVLFIFLLLSAQFTSFIDPLIILFVVPFSMAGAALALWVSGGSFNLYSNIGLITLVGLVSKHGILITKFVNQLREEGEDLLDAIVNGASIRLRPILMTTAAMVFGSLPLAFASGPGSVGRQQIGWVIVGGLLLGTLFSLYLVPMVYAYLGKYKKITVHNNSVSSGVASSDSGKSDRKPASGSDVSPDEPDRKTGFRSDSNHSDGSSFDHKSDSD